MLLKNIIAFIRPSNKKNKDEVIANFETLTNALAEDTNLETAFYNLVANVIIHQDLTITGAAPMIEIFSNRLEITNPGAPIVDVIRFLDTPPRSRNELMAAFMRRIGICEERGSGIDKVVCSD